MDKLLALPSLWAILPDRIALTRHAYIMYLKSGETPDLYRAGGNFKAALFDVDMEKMPQTFFMNGDIAIMQITGIITTKGRFTPDITREEFVLAQGKEKIVVSKGDIDVFQQAKAAVGVGIKVLVEEAGMSYNDLERVCVGGSFGYFLNVENAQAIGLLPKIGPHHVELCGNTALAGCEDILLSSVASEHLMSVRDKARIINPAQRSDFEDLFLKSLYLEPLKGD